MTNSGEFQLRMLMDLTEKQDADRVSSLVVQIATLSLLVDGGLASAEQAAERLEQFHAILPDHLQSEHTRKWIEQIASSLRTHEPAGAPRWKPEVLLGGLSAPPPPPQTPGED